MRKDDEKRPKRGVQYPDREFDRKWERKRREAEEAKQREIDKKRRRRYSSDDSRYSRMVK